MKFLNGWKTILGVLVTVGTVAVNALGKDGSIVGAVGSSLDNIVTHGASIVAGAGGLLTMLGIIHKVEKKS